MFKSSKNKLKHSLCLYFLLLVASFTISPQCARCLTSSNTEVRSALSFGLARSLSNHSSSSGFL